MFKSMKEWFYAIFFLFALFSESIFHCYMILRGLVVESGQLKYMFIVVAAIGYMTFLLDLLNNRYSIEAKRFIAVLFGIVAIYGCTSLFYGTASGYISQLLRYGSISISIAILGVHAATNEYFDKINRLIPFFIIPLSIVLGSLGMSYAAMGDMIRQNDDSGLTYQSMAYFMAFYFVCAAYYALVANVAHKGFWMIVRFAAFGVMAYSALVCVMSGGRGAVVYLVSVALIIVYSMYNNGRLSKIKIFGIVLAAVAVFAYCFVALNVSDSVGFSRLSEKMTDSSSRDNLYNLAWNAFLDSAGLGNGLGSCWWTVGWYSHNMVLDLLAEIGLIGAAIVLIVILKTCRRSLVLGKYEPFYDFVLFIFLEGLVRGMFSDYWLSLEKLWLGFSFVFCTDYKNLLEYYIIKNESEIYE